MKTTARRETKTKAPSLKLRAGKTKKKTRATRKSQPLSWRQWLHQAFHESAPPDWIPAPYLAMVNRRVRAKRKTTIH